MLSSRNAVEAFYLFLSSHIYRQALTKWIRLESKAYFLKNYVIIYEYYGPAINIYLIITEAKPIK